MKIPPTDAPTSWYGSFPPGGHQERVEIADRLLDGLV
jgi:hypothetical protein